MKPSLLNLFVITRRCLSDKRMPGLDLVHRNRAYATHPMSDDPVFGDSESFALPFRLWRLHKCLV